MNSNFLSTYAIISVLVPDFLDFVFRVSRTTYLALPFPGANGRCQLGNYVRYFIDTEAQPCVEGGTVAAFCKAGGELSGKHKLLDQLFVAKTLHGYEVAEWSEVSKWVQVERQFFVVDRCIYIHTYIHTYIHLHTCVYSQKSSI